MATHWLVASGRIPWIDWSDHPVWFVALMALIPLYRELHFYLIHRSIHWPPPVQDDSQPHLAMAPVPGHSGFERIEVGDGLIDTNGYAHYIHHKYFEVNYADGAFPLDKWFGSFHDGSPESDAAMKRRRRARATQ